MSKKNNDKKKINKNSFEKFRYDKLIRILTNQQKIHIKFPKKYSEKENLKNF